MTTTRTTRHIKAPREAIYQALIDEKAVATWRVPAGMTGHVHEFNAKEGGSFRVSLIFDATGTCTTTARTGTYHGHFLKLVPNEQVVEVLEFETTDPQLRGEMMITTTLAAADGGTDVLMVHEGIPNGVSSFDNETGARMALAKLAELLEVG